MSVDDDARVFGQHFKQGGWRLGLLVARNVELRQGKRTDLSTSGQVTDGPVKVSGAEFAEMAGVSKQCVANYYKAWQLAAEDGKCLRAEELAPGEEDLADLEENDDHTREEWSKYLQMAKEPREPRETGRPQGAKTSSAEAAEPTTPQTKAAKAVKAVVDTAEQFHKKLSQVLDSVGPTLMGEDAGVAAFAEQLRQARFELDKHCQEIDRLLDRIGYGDTEAQPEGADA